MKLQHLVVREILHRKFNFALAVLSVVIAVGSLVAQLLALRAHDARTAQILAADAARSNLRLAELDKQVRQAMAKLGLNIVILPKDQNLADWYAEDYAAKTMPAEYADRLARAGLMSITRLVPMLRQKVLWPETKWTIIVVGVPEKLPGTPAGPGPGVWPRPVAPGTAIIGHELHEALGLKVGQKIKLLGREFTVQACRGEQGTKDDVTVWINLAEAQELFDKKGRINEIHALQCRAGWTELPHIRREITNILPDTQVIERRSKVLALAESRLRLEADSVALIEQHRRSRERLRRERQRLAAVLVPLVLIACGTWVALLTMRNVRDRRVEIGTLRALGYRSRQILALFLSRAVATGLVGGVLGCLAGTAAGWRSWTAMVHGPGSLMANELLNGKLLGLGMALAVALTAAASAVPAALAARQDPAVVLQEE